MCAQEPTDAHIAYTGLLVHHHYIWHSRSGVTTATARRTVHHMLGHPLDIGATRNSFGHPHSSGPWVSLAAAKRCRMIGFRHLSSRLRDRRMAMAPASHVSHKSYGCPARKTRSGLEDGGGVVSWRQPSASPPLRPSRHLPSPHKLLFSPAKVPCLVPMAPAPALACIMTPLPKPYPLLSR